MNPFKAIKLYLRWKPQIQEAEAAVKDAQGGDMKGFLDKISHILYPVLYAAAGGAFGALADYAHTLVGKESIDLPRMGTIALAGAAMALKAYFQQPKQKTE